jgi:hypothetical protein
MEASMTSEEMREFGALLRLPKVTAKERDRLDRLCEALGEFSAAILGEGPPNQSKTVRNAGEKPAILTLGFPHSADMHRVLEWIAERRVEAFIVGASSPGAARSPY